MSDDWTSGPFVLLDDAQIWKDGRGGVSRLYSGYVRTHTCRDPGELEQCWALAKRDLLQGLHAVVLADYEWGARLQGVGLPVEAGVTDPSLRLLMFSCLTTLDEQGVQAFLREADASSEQPTPAGTLYLGPEVGETDFVHVIEDIQSAIAAGEVYQVNYTYRLQGMAWGTPAGLYRRLRSRQRVGFGAFVALPPDGPPGSATHVLSCSPELFLQHVDGWIEARPMKGTAASTGNPDSDSLVAQTLRLDPKNRAENVMIVDLLRNDLGRISEIGSVQVPSMFDVEHYATVLQMTSTVRSRLLPNVDFPSLLRATFPCGSIAGAPKLAAMHQICRREPRARGLYCGAIGWIEGAPEATERALGPLSLSVAIRTLTLGPVNESGLRPLLTGVGSGIVSDSLASEEWSETLTKSKFLVGTDPGIGLFETIRIEARPVPVAVDLECHFERLSRSARAFGFVCDFHKVSAAVDSALSDLVGSGPWRLRLDLSHDGRIAIRAAPLPPLEVGSSGFLLLGWASHVLPTCDPLSAHKTTRRAHYDEAVRIAEAMGCFDLLFVNAAGRVVEGGRSSLFVQIEGRWFTPPVTDGALPGVCRAGALVHGIDGLQVVEKSLSVADVQGAQAWAVGNALRGVVPAVLHTSVGHTLE